MTKKEVKKRIGEGFAELAPDISEAVIKSAAEQGIVFSSEHPQKEAGFWKKMIRGRRFRYAPAVCAVLALACISVLRSAGVSRDAASLVVDINPSVRIGMDASGRVGRLEGLDGDGRLVEAHLDWEKGEPVAALLDALVEGAAELSYLKEDGGILVTIFAPDEEKYEELEDIVGRKVGKKLEELNLSGVTVALRRSEGSRDAQGREILEEELVRAGGLTKEEARRMPVAELIRRCKDSAALNLQVSEQPEGGDGEEKKSKDEEEKEPKDVEEEKKQEDGDKERGKDVAGKNVCDLNHPMERVKEEGRKDPEQQEDPVRTGGDEASETAGGSRKEDEASGAASSEALPQPSADIPSQLPAIPAEPSCAEPPAPAPSQPPAASVPSSEEKEEKKDKKKKKKEKKEKKEKKQGEKEEKEKENPGKKPEKNKPDKENQKKENPGKKDRNDNKGEQETERSEKKQEGKKEVGKEEPDQR